MESLTSRPAMSSDKPNPFAARPSVHFRDESNVAYDSLDKKAPLKSILREQSQSLITTQNT